MAQAVTPITRDPQIEALKLPPYSLEAEQSVLGGLLLDNSAWEKIADAVSDADFYRADHRQIYRHISVLIEGNKPADALTVAESLERSGKLEEVGGQAYIGSLAVNTPSAANIRRYAEIVRERAIMRRLAEVGTEITESVFSPLGRSAKELLDNAEKQVFAIAEAGARGQQGFREIQPLLTQVVERIDTLYKRDNPSDVTGIPTGFTDLDRMTSGLQPGDLVVVAGRPSMGKTAFALNVAEHVALVEKMPAAIFSMEMSGSQLVMRMLGSLGRLDQHKMRTGSLNDDDWQKLTASVGRLSEAPVFVDESGMLNPTELRGRARRLHRQCGGPGLGLIVVDYLQLMETGNSTENRATEVAEISRSLKAVAKELNVPVMALSQLNRGLEQRPNKRPVMSDLRECVVGETLVLLTDGRRVPVKDLVGTEPEVWAMSQDRKIISARSDKVWSVGVKPVFRLTLASGKVLRATAKHRVYGSNGWVRVEELQVGDRLATARNVPEPRNPHSWDESDLALLTVPQAAFEEVKAGMRTRGVSQRKMASCRAQIYRAVDPAETVGRAEAAPYNHAWLWAEDDLFWDRVVEVIPDGIEEVFDLTVPGPASWLADGVVSHNSGAIEQDADLILFIYRDEVYNQESPDKGTAEIIIGKQRNGPIGTVKLTFLGQHTRFENFAAPGRF